MFISIRIILHVLYYCMPLLLPVCNCCCLYVTVTARMRCCCPYAAVAAHMSWLLHECRCCCPCAAVAAHMPWLLHVCRCCCQYAAVVAHMPWLFHVCRCYCLYATVIACMALLLLICHCCCLYMSLLLRVYVVVAVRMSLGSWSTRDLARSSATVPMTTPTRRSASGNSASHRAIRLS